MTDPIVHFEIPANDVIRAKKFYETLFGWEISYMKEFDYYDVKAQDGETGINGGMMQRKHPQQPAMNYIHVKSVDATIKKAQTMGAKLCMPKMAIGEMGWIAAIQDPEGNMVGLHEINAAGMKKMMAKKAAEKKAVKKPAAKKKKQ